MLKLSRITLGILFSLAPLRVLFPLDFLAADEQAAAYRTGVQDPQVLKVPPRIQGGLISNSDTSLPALVEFLVAGADNDFVKVKRIHDWITENIAYDTEGFYGGERATNILRDKRATCGGFSKLFAQMAQLAGIQVVTISGKSRVAFDTKTGEMAGHVWNAVGINGKWYLVDTTHDDRFSYDKGAFGKKSPYRDTQLFISPAGKIIENIPNDEKYQYLNSPKSLAEFLAFPQISLRFARLGLSFSDGAPPISKEKKTHRGTRILLVKDHLRLDQNIVRIRLNAPPGIAFAARIVSATGAKVHTGHALCHRDAQIVECAFSAPGTGEYQAYISARENAVEKVHNKIYEFTLVGANGAGAELPEPHRLYIEDALTGFGIKILAHNLADTSAPEYFLEVEYPATAAVFSTLWDAKDQKIKGSSKTSGPVASAEGFRVRYTYQPPGRGTYFVKLRVKPADAKLFNDTAAIAKIIRP